MSPTPLRLHGRGVVIDLSDDDVGHLVRYGIGGAKAQRRRSDGVNPAQRLLAEVANVVDDVVGE